MLAQRDFHVPRDVASCALSVETFQVQRRQAHSALLELSSTNDEEVLAIVYASAAGGPPLQPPRHHCQSKWVN